MDNNEIARAYCKYFESHLVSRFKATGDGLTEKVRSVSAALEAVSPALPSQLKTVARVRNAIEHEHGFEVQEPGEFFRICKDAAKSLGLRPLRPPYRPTVSNLLFAAAVALLAITSTIAWLEGGKIATTTIATVKLEPGVPLIRHGWLHSSTILYDLDSRTLSIMTQNWTSPVYTGITSACLFILAYCSKASNPRDAQPFVHRRHTRSP